MAKKTQAYDEGYTVGQASLGLGSNPYNESEQYDQWSDWKTGYADGIADAEEDPIDTNEDDDYEDDDYEE
jgi:hypothetical protein